MSQAVYKLFLREGSDCEKAATELARSHPDVVFTSGRRAKDGQASAMAANVVFCLNLWIDAHPKASALEASKRGRTWIRDTYKDTFASRACQYWIDAHPEAVTRVALFEGLLSVLNNLTDEQLSQLSYHFTGDAFDVLPVQGNTGAMILQTLKHIVAKYSGKLLLKEGGRIVWHAQFQRPS